MGLIDSIGKVFSAISPIGAIASGVGSLIGGITTGSAQKKAQREANETNLQIARENNQTSIDIARENNALQQSMMRENNEWSRQQAIDMFNLENAYNTPLEQVKRFQEAGLNPAVMMEGAGGSAAGNSSASAPSAAGSGISPSMPTLTTPHIEAVPPMSMGFLDALEKISRIKLTDRQAGKTESEQKTIDDTRDVLLKNLVSDAVLKQVQIEQESFDLTVDQTFKVKERAEGLKKIAADYTLAIAQGETEKAKKLFIEAEKALTNAKESQVREQAPILLSNLRKQGELIDAEKATEKSKQAANYASASRDSAAASLTRSQKRLLDDQHDDLVRAQKAQADHSEQSLKEAVQSMAWRMEKLYNEGLLSKAQWLQAEEALKLAEKENDWYHWNQAFEKIERTNRAVNSWFSITNY